MATVVAGNSTANTGNNQAIAVTGFSTTAGDLLIAFAVVSGQSAGGTFTSNGGLTWVQVGPLATKNVGADSLVCAIAQQFDVTQATSRTVTFTPAGSPTSTGVAISVMRVSGMAKTGSAAVRQSSKEDGKSSGTPAPLFASAPLTANCCLGAVANGSNPANLSVTTSGGTWTERHDTGYGTPNTGLETQSINSGFTTAQVTWGSSSASGFASMIVELDTSIPLLDDDAPRYCIWPDNSSVGVYC